MKQPIIIKAIYIGLVLFCTTAFAQDEEKIKRVGDGACGCTHDIDVEQTKDSILSQLHSCISGEIMKEQLMALTGELGNLDETAETDPETGKKTKNITIYADENFDEIQAYMLKNCPNVKRLIGSNNETTKNSMSKNKKALKYYKEGQDYDNTGNTDMAIVAYSNAVKADPKFAFAWDNLGLDYRKRGNLEKAVECYRKSLKADPDGVTPLQNMGVAYIMLEDFDSAAKAYDELIAKQPDNPEGYYGAGRAYYFAGDYAKGVDNMFKAYLKYKETGSPYVSDAENTLGAFYKDLDEKGQLDIFKKAAEDNNINLE